MNRSSKQKLSLMMLSCASMWCVASSASAYDMYEMTSGGRGNIGLNTSLSLTQSVNELEAGGQSKNTTFFMLAAPKFGYFVTDRLETQVQAGALLRRLQRSADDGSTETSALINVGINYHIPMNARLSLIPGIGIGGYFGRGSRPALVADTQNPGEFTTIQESTSSRGLDLSSQLSIGYRATEKAQIQAGVGFHYLFGGEFSDSTDTLRVTTLNTSLLVGAMYFF